MSLKLIKTTPAKCSLDLGDGSERAFYVNQDYIFQKLHKAHRGVSLMYTYYPNDKTWPVRASVANKNAKSAWDYPYEDYFPYRGGREHKLDDEPFNFMKEIRMHGQEVVLTLTIDPFLKEEDIIIIAKDLRNYGRLLLRINHECTGDWFCYTKRASYEQIASFFVMCCDVFHEYAPNIKLILCAGMYLKETGKLEMEDIFLEAHKKADIWSGDQYLSLHWGWPHDVATKETSNYACYDVDEIYEKAKNTYLRLCKITGQNKPMVLSELNGDADVTGAFEQSYMMKHFMTRVQKEKHPWLSAFTLYQFRDDGRLGLEVTDPNNSEIGIEQPILGMYIEEMHKPCFCTGYQTLSEAQLPVKLRWGAHDDAEAVEMEIKLKKQPVFFELNFPKEIVPLAMIIEFDTWSFYKAPGVSFIDLMPYFFKNKIKRGAVKKLRFFCPPQDGLNHPVSDTDKNEDLLYNCYTTLTALPSIRLEYEPVSLAKKYRD